MKSIRLTLRRLLPQQILEDRIESKLGLGFIANEIIIQTTGGFPSLPTLERGLFYPFYFLTRWTLWGWGGYLTPAAFLAGHRMAPGRVLGQPVCFGCPTESNQHSGHLEAGFLRNCLAFAHRTLEMFRAFLPMNPNTSVPQGLGTWILPQNCNGVVGEGHIF